MIASIVLVSIFIIIQFLGPSRPENRLDNPNDLIVSAQLDNNVAAILREACYDCHSMETRYPWYASIAPVKWGIYDHIIEGREELNFSEWNAMEKRSKIRKLKDLAEEVEEREMPMESYIKMHPEADLSAEQRQLLTEWANDYARIVIKQ